MGDLRLHGGLLLGGILRTLQQVPGALCAPEVLRGYPSISDGGAYGGVAEQHLHYPDVTAGLQKVCGKAVTQAVHGDLLGEAGFLHSLLQDLMDRGGTDGAVGILPAEEIDSPSTEAFVVLTQQYKHLFAEHHIAIFVAFCTTDVNEHSFAVNVGEP